jgi:hypothetical protein
MRRVKCTELVLDFDLYPRQSVDSYHVNTIAEAMRAGNELPPVVIDRKSRRVVDGFHRIKARLRLDGNDATIEIIEKTYKNDAELFVDAVRYNAGHGRNLSACDRAHVLIRAEQLGIDTDAIAGVLHVRIDSAAELKAAHTARAGSLQSALAIPIKRTIRHMAGKPLTKDQVAANEKLGGMEQLFYVNQIVTLIESGLLDKKNDRLMAGLAKLHELLGDLVGAPA